MLTFPAAEQTEIGERGVTISGGQKARINFARAVYHTLVSDASGDRPILILDSPLAAVDVHVGKKLFKTIKSGALQGFTRVLATNQLEYLPQCDHIISLAEGQIEFSGTFDELIATELPIASLIQKQFMPAQPQQQQQINGSDDGDDAVLKVFLKVFNEQMGFSGDHPHIAHLERELKF